MAIRLWIRNGKVVVVGRLCPIPIFWSASINEAAWWHDRHDDRHMPIKDHDHAWPFAYPAHPIRRFVGTIVHPLGSLSGLLSRSTCLTAPFDDSHLEASKASKA